MSDRIQQHIQLLETHDDPDVRRQAAEELAEANTPNAISALAQALKDRNKGVRDAANRSLLAIGGIEVARLVAPFIRDHDIAVRNLAAELLYRLGEHSIFAVEPYLHDSDQDVRKMAVDIIGLLRHKGAAIAIAPMLEDPDPNVVISAAEALGNIGSELAVPHLIQLFEKQDYTRPVVSEALGKIKGEKATEFLSKSFEKEIQTKSDPLTLFGIIEALGSIGDAKAFSLLAGYLPGVKGKLRRMMLAAMVWISDKAQMPLDIPGASTEDLIDLLNDSDLRVRLNAVKVLANYPESRITQAFVDILGSSEYFDVVLFGILESREEGIPIIMEKLRAPGCKQKKELISLVRTIAQRLAQDAETFGAKGVPEKLLQEAFTIVEEQWHSGDEETRHAIVETLFVLDGDRALAVLDTLMNDPDPWLRMRVIELLGTLDDERLPEFVARYITDEDEMVRQTVEWILESKGFSLSSNSTI
jgi:HEAT repeat protein